jgi:choline dehydrogenase-like flavoprotein
VITDLRALPSHSIFDTDLCVIGGGAAGVAIAHDLSGSGLRVVLAESGGFEHDPAVQSLYKGENRGGAYGADLDACRSRYFGGSTNCWGGMCLPLSEWDFRQREWVSHSGWPIRYQELEPYLIRAHELCDGGPYMYGSEVLKSLPFEEQPFDPDLLDVHFWHMNRYWRRSQIRFAHRFGRELRASRNVTVLLNANVTKFSTHESGSRVEQVEAKTLEGKTALIRAKWFVLACGGIENARLLLASNETNQRGLGNDYDLVGRFFMEHPHVACGSVSTEPEHNALSSYARLWRLGKSRCRPGLSLSPTAQKQNQTLAASVSIDPFFDPKGAWVLLQKLRERVATRDAACPSPRSVLRALSQSRKMVGHLYNRAVSGSWPAGESQRFVVYARTEQSPNPCSRVTLSDERDSLGMRRVCLDWKMSDIDRKTLLLVSSVARSEFARLGLGLVTEADWISEGVWPPRFDAGPHHMGTTRMSASPRDGVVDPNAKLHSVDNLYVAGSSIFPTSGHANPTLTLLATSLRLADHIRSLTG